MNRRILAAFRVSLVIVGRALFVCCGGRERDAAPLPAEVAGAPGDDGAAGGRAGDAGAAGTKDSAAKDAAEKDQPAPEDRGPPLLRGRVIGEGTGIPGATVRIYSTRLVEQAIDRLQEVIPEASGGGGMPDIMAIISLVRDELENIRRSGESARTDHAGAYEFRRLPSGGYLVLALADGWLFRFGDVASLADGRTQTLDLELSRGSSIGGRVVN